MSPVHDPSPGRTGPGRSLACPTWRVVLLFAGAVPVLSASALAYGLSAARRGALGDSALVAAILFVGVAALVRLSGCRELRVAVPMAAVVGLLAVPAGHVVGFADAPAMAAAYFDAHPDELAPADRGQPAARFAAYVERATGSRGDSFLSYLRLQVALGARMERVPRIGPRFGVSLSGLAVVAVWIGQLLLLPLLAASAVFAVVPDGEASGGSRAEISPPESRR